MGALFSPQRASGNAIFGPQQFATLAAWLTSSALTFNNGEPHIDAPFIATVLDLTTSAVVARKAGLTAVFSSVPEDHYEIAFTDSALVLDTFYAVWWNRFDIGTHGAHGIEILQAKAP